MKKLILLLLLVSLACAETYTQTQFETQTTTSPFEIVKDWRVLSVLALMVSVILVAIAYSIGVGFEIPEIRAWANSELTQIIANAIIIGALIITIAFVDGIIMAIVAGSGLDIPDCYTPGGSCMQATVNEYFSSYLDSAKSIAREVVGDNLEAAQWANRRIGLNCITILCIQLGFTTTILGNMMMFQDYFAIVFEYCTNLISFMESQKFFVNQICFKMGPAILAIGIVARAFFITRKVGGLLIAIAAGVMFFFPMMYVFDWMTLDLTVSGDKLMNDQTSSCPAECSLQLPLAIVQDENKTKLLAPKDIYHSFSYEEEGIAKQMVDGEIDHATGSNGSANGHEIISCLYPSDMDECPQACRVLPYSTAPVCVNLSAGTQAKCAKVPEDCKARMLVNTSGPFFDEDEYEKCPESCRVVPPLKSNCDVLNCLKSRLDCRMSKRTNLTWRPTPPHDAGRAAECRYAADCNASLVATESCVYVVPDTGRCDDLCGDCPAHCRIAGANVSRLPPDCTETDGSLKGSCEDCLEDYDTCAVTMTQINALAPPDPSCNDCWAERRVVYSTLPEEYTLDLGETGKSCSLTSCPQEYRAAIPRNTCESCLFTEEAYAYDPPLLTECGELCKPSSNPPMKGAGTFGRIGASGMVGQSEVQDLAKLMIPAYLLPLFNIVATLVFIKGLSGLLGGDIEIPGLSKVF